MIPEDLFRIFQSLILVVFVLHRAYYNRKYPPAFEETIEAQAGGRTSQITNLLAFPALVSSVLYVVNPAWMAWSFLPLPVWFRIVGILIALFGFALLQWSHLVLGENWSDQPRITLTQSLVTSGPYRFVRHPIYLSFITILGSSLLITSNWFIGIAWIGLTTIDIHNRIDFEESRLHTRFGESFESYKHQTGGLLPRFRKRSKNKG